MGVIPASRADARSPRGRQALCVVVNGNASGATMAAPVGHLLARLREECADVELIHTRTLGELASVWRLEDRRRLVLVGGDGTVHSAVNLEGAPRDLALIPAGRANNIARSLGIPLDWKRAAELAVHGEVRPVDLIEARCGDRTRLVVESVSVGFLAQARARYHARNSADLLEGARAGVAALARFHPLAVRVARPNGNETLHLSQLFVANLPLYEFGLRVAPHADPTDSLLDLIAIDAPTRHDVLRMLVDLRRGTHLHRRNVHAWRATQATIETDGCSPIIADSSDLGPGPVHLCAAPGALRLVRP